MADINLTDKDFEEKVLKSETPVVVDFWAPWCAPCRIVTPIIHELAKEYEGKINVYEMNVDEEPNASGNYGVMSIPTIMIFKGGQPVKSFIGAQSKDTYKKGFDEAL